MLGKILIGINECIPARICESISKGIETIPKRIIGAISGGIPSWRKNGHFLRNSKRIHKINPPAIWRNSSWDSSWDFSRESFEVLPRISALNPSEIFPRIPLGIALWISVITAGISSGTPTRILYRILDEASHAISPIIIFESRSGIPGWRIPCRLEPTKHPEGFLSEMFRGITAAVTIPSVVPKIF